jgi:hypothetical protein
MTVDTALDGIKVYGDCCRKYNADVFVISKGFWMNTVLAYGGPALDPTFPQTIETKDDKRYWVREKFLKKVIPRFMLLSSTYDISKRLTGNPFFTVTNVDDYGVGLIENNKMITEDFMALERTHEYYY